MVELNLKNIYKKYPNSDHYSVEDFNLDIKDKEFIVFVGPSGCGKSTTLRMIAGLVGHHRRNCLYWRYSGQWCGAKRPRHRHGLPELCPLPTYDCLRQHGLWSQAAQVQQGRYWKRVNEAAEILGLKEFLQRKPADLSGGQRQRVAMGRAIVRDAKVFLWMSSV